MNDHVAWELIKKLRADMDAMFATCMAAISAITGELEIYANTAAAQAARVNAKFVCVLSDYNSAGAIFIKDVTYTPLLQGADGFTDLAGTTFKRFQNE